MKDFERVKRINGRDYLYKISPYYDKQSKKIRHKSKYLGRMENGKVVRPFKPLPRLVYSYGEFVPLQQVFQELGIDKILGEICDDTDATVIKTLVFNRILRPLALQNVESWQEGTILAKDVALPLSSQSLSRFMSKLGTSSISEHFFEKFIRKNGHVDSLVFDITSLSSYSQLNSLLEYGYNRDDDNLPQFNLSLAVDKSKGIPLMYDIYPGSINDVSTIHNSIQKMKSFGLEFSALIIDRGFFSSSNIDELIQKKIPFITAAPFALKEVKQTISQLHSDIEDANHMQMYEKKPIFVKPINMNVGEHQLEGFLYYDLKREQEEKSTFYTRLHETKNRLEQIIIRKWMNPQNVFEEWAKDLQQYYAYSVQGERFKIDIKTNAVAQRVNKMGKMILLHSGGFKWEECLSNYRQKDIVEKNFRVMKTTILQSPLNAQKSECVRGWIFILYLTLIIRFKLQHMIHNKKLHEKYSVETLLLELEKIKKVELNNGEIITTEITKKQREILTILNLCA